MTTRKRLIVGAVTGGILAPILVLAWSVIRYNQILAQMPDNGPAFSVMEVVLLQYIVAPASIPVGAVLGAIVAHFIGLNKRKSG